MLLIVLIIIWFEKKHLDDSGLSLPVFPSRNNLKLHNISVTPRMVRKVIMNLDLSKASGPDCIPVVVVYQLSNKMVPSMSKNNTT